MIAIATYILLTTLHQTAAFNNSSCTDVQQHKNFHLILPTSKCLPYFESRIMGGENADLGEFVWMAVLYTQEKNPNAEKLLLCGGTVINNKYILTAAHCLLEQLLESQILTVRVGELDLDQEEACEGSICAPKPVDHEVEEYLGHPNFTDISTLDDIALIRVKGTIAFNDYVYPACLPTTCYLMERSLVGVKSVVAGWGDLVDEPYPVRPRILQKVFLYVVDNRVCGNYYSWSDKTLQESDKLLCVGGSEGGDLGKDVCHGDSGGPLMYRDLRLEGRLVVAGVVSQGPDCSVGDVTDQGSGVYTRVAAYMPWILDNIRE